MVIKYGCNTFFEKEIKSSIFEFSKSIKISKDRIELLNDVSLDFGGFGKGYLIDKIASKLEFELGHDKFMINGGGDILSSGNISRVVVLEHPFKPGYEHSRILLTNVSLGSSSNSKRRWKTKNTHKLYGHIIDPRSKSPEASGTIKEEQYGSFVITKTALMADIIATVLCVLGNDQENINRLKES